MLGGWQLQGSFAHDLTVYMIFLTVEVLCPSAAIDIGSSSQFPAMFFWMPAAGFISLDCGGDQEYTDSNNITWIPDNTSFVQTGSVATLPTANNQSSIPQSLTRLRYFPNNQSKNCYTLPGNLSTRYLIRATFLYGNYDGATTNPIFDISLDATIWATITILNATETYYQEIVDIAQSRSSIFSVCLLNVNQGTPFLSSLELRPLFGSIYGLSYLSAAYLSSMLRINFGAPSFASVR